MHKEKILITVVTHNGGQNIKNCIKSIKEVPAGIDFDVIVVDSDTNNPADLEYLRQIQNERIGVIRKSPSRYDTGGYFHVWKEYRDKYDYYLFLQDDTVMMEENWLKRIFDYQRQHFPKNNGVVALSIFHGNWHGGHVEYVKRIMGYDLDTSVPCVFGPIYFAPKEVLQKFEEKGFMREEIMPTQKMEVEGWECAMGHILRDLDFGVWAIMGRRDHAISPVHYQPGYIIKHQLVLRQ